MDSTTRDLLMAILNPVQQLAATLVIILIMMNIFAGVIFVFFRNDFNNGFTVNSLWDMLKTAISYGFRGEYGELQKLILLNSNSWSLYLRIKINIKIHSHKF